MKIKRKATILYCENIEMSRNFYSNVLGLSIEMDMGSVIFYKEGIAIWELKEGHILNTLINTGGKGSNVNTFELYFEVVDWEDTLQRLNQWDIDYLHRTVEEPWGQRTIRIFDPDTNIIEIGETLEQFIRRLYDKGVSKEEIARLNEISVDEVTRILDNKV
jgi:catechol 2,3-dioxygenase-like lactoylglutathione lyase family enzyme